jgi:3-oxoacyl-[acyl-carrier protein] reductase
MNSLPRDRNVLVTGATRGIGIAICRRLITDGYTVIGVARSISPEFEQLQREYEARVSFQRFDLFESQKIVDLCREVVRGRGRIYGLVNNAGIGCDGILSTMHETDINKLIAVNLHAPILLSKYLSRGMLLNRSGRIINISSIIAENGFNGLSVYAATKAGLFGFTRSLAREIGRAGVTVNCVAPGFVESEMTSKLDVTQLEKIRRRSPSGRFPLASEIAAAVGFLISDDAAAITGTTVTVDAGSTA